MTIDLNKLKTMSKEELIELARKVNAPHHHSNKPETLIENIINKVTEPTTNPQAKTDGEKKIKVAVFLTEEELEKAVARLKEQRPVFSTVYDRENRCVTLRYNDGRHRHAETMSLSCSLPKFIRKAQEIAKGPLILRAHRAEDWEQLGGNAKNAYTNVVL